MILVHVHKGVKLYPNKNDIAMIYCYKKQNSAIESKEKDYRYIK